MRTLRNAHKDGQNLPPNRPFRFRFHGGSVSDVATYISRVPPPVSAFPSSGFTDPYQRRAAFRDEKDV